MNLIAQSSNKALWLDLKNADHPENCQVALELINTQTPTLVEFPSTIVKHLDGLENCLHGFKEKVMYRSYYINTKKLSECTQGVKSACKSLKSDIDKIRKSNFFTDLSFDSRGFKVMKKINSDQKFSLSAWWVELGSQITPQLNYAIINAKELEALSRR